MGYVFQNADTQLFCGSVEGGNCVWTCPDGIVGSSSRERTEDRLQLLGLKKLRERPPITI